MTLIDVGLADELSAAFGQMQRSKAEALLAIAGVFTFANGKQIVISHLPTTCPLATRSKQRSLQEIWCASGLIWLRWPDRRLRTSIYFAQNQAGRPPAAATCQVRTRNQPQNSTALGFTERFAGVMAHCLPEPNFTGDLLTSPSTCSPATRIAVIVDSENPDIGVDRRDVEDFRASSSAGTHHIRCWQRTRCRERLTTFVQHGVGAIYMLHVLQRR
jgi:hypothetical protein